MGTYWEPLNEVEANEIIRLYESGLGGDKIIDELALDCSRPTIIGWLRRNNIKIKIAGETGECKNCGCDFIRVQHSQKLCKTCMPDQSKHHIYQKHGITAIDIEEMLEEQGYLCACCSEPFTNKRKYYVDHCHKQGHVRALVCNSCNIGLGFIENDKRLAQAFRYIEKYKR